MLNKLPYKFAKSLVENNLIDDEDFEIYRYGFETLIYFIINISVVLFIGIIFDRFIHTIIFLSGYCTLRQFTGGYHARNYIECTLTFAVIYLITIFLANSIDIEKYRYLMIVLMLISIFIIYKRAPLEHRNKPLSEVEKSNYKRTSIKIVSVIGSIVVLSVLFNKLIEYTIYYLFAIIWIGILLIVASHTEQ